MLVHRPIPKSQKQEDRRRQACRKPNQTKSFSCLHNRDEILLYHLLQATRDEPTETPFARSKKHGYPGLSEQSGWKTHGRANGSKTDAKILRLEKTKSKARALSSFSALPAGLPRGVKRLVTAGAIRVCFQGLRFHFFEVKCAVRIGPAGRTPRARVSRLCSSTSTPCHGSYFTHSFRPFKLTPVLGLDFTMLKKA